MLERVLPLVDWVGMDLKSDFKRHESITRVRGSGERAGRSMELIRASGVACRFHTVSLRGSDGFLQAAHDVLTNKDRGRI